MLRELTIRDFVIVHEASLEFHAGFTALTGETGAGKSILIDALAAALGERGDALLVRAGAKQAEVGAQFDLAAVPGARAWLAELGMEDDSGVCLVRRVIDAGGRSRAFINGRAATVAQLRELGAMLVDIHGQHAHQSLLRSPAQRELLDAFAGEGGRAERVAQAHALWRERAERWREAQLDSERVTRERDALAWQMQELDALGFRADEWSELTAEHVRVANAAALIETASAAVDQLSETDTAVLPRLTAVIGRIERQLEHDAALASVLEMLEPARIQVQEAAHALARYGARLEVDPRRLAELERRIEAVHTACRKYRTTPEQLAQVIETTRARLAALEQQSDLVSLARARTEAEQAYLELARGLSDARRKAAAKLARQVTAALSELALAGGRFEIVLDAIEEGAAFGLERVEFCVATHREAAPGPLGRVASGGELSRVSLAIQSVLSKVARVPTLIFDEVDAGIGGRVAGIVGRMLRTLGERHQVMCVTHLPQVAACAAQQWTVEKATRDGRATSHVRVLDASERVEEIARMLGGMAITEATRRHAAEMLASAAGSSP